MYILKFHDGINNVCSWLCPCPQIRICNGIYNNFTHFSCSWHLHTYTSGSCLESEDFQGLEKSLLFAYRKQLRQYQIALYIWVFIFSGIYCQCVITLDTPCRLDINHHFAYRAPFTKMDSQQQYVITSVMKCGMKIFILSQTSKVWPLKFGNGKII